MLPKKDGTTVVYCYNQTCRLAAEAALELAAHGFPVIEMEGGFAAWEGYGLPVER
jgi:rhodanese-related sulfurtransferase